MDLSGNWKYSEDFEYGTSYGQVTFEQEGDKLSGLFTFTEEVKNSYKIEVTENVSGIISNGKVLLTSDKVTALQDGRVIDYLPNSFEVHLTSEDKLVGSTFDSENICGVFVLERIKDI